MYDNRKENRRGTMQAIEQPGREAPKLDVDGSDAYYLA